TCRRQLLSTVVSCRGPSGTVKVVIFGAAGQTGRLLIERAVANGHGVAAFVRDPTRVNIPDRSVRVVEGDVLDSAAVDRALAGQEGVLVALGTATRGSPQVLPQGIRHILDAMEAHGVRRVVILSAAGALHEKAGSILGSLGLMMARALLPGEYREYRPMLEGVRAGTSDRMAAGAVISGNWSWRC